MWEFWLFLVSSMTWVCAAQTAKSAAPAEIAIRAGKVLDVRTGNYLSDQTIWIEGDRIKAIGKTVGNFQPVAGRDEDD